MQSAVLTFETHAVADNVLQFYDSELKKEGWQPAGSESDGGGGPYMKRDDSFEGITFTGGEGGGFPWFRIKRSQARLWVSVRVMTVYRNDNKWSHVSIEMMQP